MTIPKNHACMINLEGLITPCHGLKMMHVSKGRDVRVEPRSTVRNWDTGKETMKSRVVFRESNDADGFHLEVCPFCHADLRLLFEGTEDNHAPLTREKAAKFKQILHLIRGSIQNLKTDIAEIERLLLSNSGTVHPGTCLTDDLERARLALAGYLVELEAEAPGCHQV